MCDGHAIKHVHTREYGHVCRHKCRHVHEHMHKDVHRHVHRPGCWCLFVLHQAVALIFHRAPRDTLLCACVRACVQACVHACTCPCLSECREGLCACPMPIHTCVTAASSASVRDEAPAPTRSRACVHACVRARVRARAHTCVRDEAPGCELLWRQPMPVFGHVFGHAS